MKNNLTKKETVIGLSIIAGLTFLALMWVSTPEAEAKKEYQPLSPQAEISYQSAAKALCEAELNLVNAKLMDNANNALSLTPEQARDLQDKKLNKKCDF